MALFIISDWFSQEVKSAFVLVHDNWDDWFSFETAYNVKYIDGNGMGHQIGQVKIGQKGLGKSRNAAPGYRIPALPSKFNELSTIFFSLGQSDYYYDNLNKLNEEFQGIRKEYLTAMRDMAYKLELYDKFKDEPVTRQSIMRSVSEPTVREQFHRMAHGGARLTPYAFGYELPSVQKSHQTKDSHQASITFTVEPESTPPTNIHAGIGRNGVGKTRLIKCLVASAFHEVSDFGHGRYYDLRSGCTIDALDLFSNLICIGFSAFDDVPRTVQAHSNRYAFVGLDDVSPDDSFDASQMGGTSFVRRINALCMSFCAKIDSIVHDDAKTRLWKTAIELLSYDKYFVQSGIAELVDEMIARNEGARERTWKVFSLLSSGHKIVLLTTACLVDAVVEKSLVILDEPETHLHPPLLAALIRAISAILIQKNGVAIVMTHSPVVLQEIPSSCCWEMQRAGSTVALRKIPEQTFGADINTLMREVFGLEAQYSGFHQLLIKALRDYDGDIDRTIKQFNNSIGMEGLLLLKSCSVSEKGRQST